jgi:hypothetical protein
MQLASFFLKCDRLLVECWSFSLSLCDSGCLSVLTPFLRDDFADLFAGHGLLM